jgi:hypothetical protein
LALNAAAEAGTSPSALREAAKTALDLINGRLGRELSHRKVRDAIDERSWGAVRAENPMRHDDGKKPPETARRPGPPL